ncbi:MAG TPA: SEC-C metal-binding domain-containing protein, partial [Candidatus Sulfotelmatobacter sp.]|nr:SEC-C metal-binding domain-containing protein [Candidatus Sulfotelmatobacter sp.]
MKAKKIGPNERCPCGSGKKFKKCHGSIRQSKTTFSNQPLQEEIRKAFEHEQAAEIQRRQQQGRGKPIISTLCNGIRIVAVGSQLFKSPNWKTFHDFLHDYIKSVFDGKWANEELKKGHTERHPLLVLYELAVRYQNQFITAKGVVSTAPATGATSAYLRLAYNLYLLAHNAKVQAILINRLMQKDAFYGAYYETFIAGALVQAGFEIEFEDET